MFLYLAALLISLKINTLRKIILIVIACLSLVNSGFSQKYVKYFLEDNQVRLIVHKKMKKQEALMVVKDSPQIYMFSTKNGDQTLQINKYESEDPEAKIEELSQQRVDGVEKVLVKQKQTKTAMANCVYTEFLDLYNYNLIFYTTLGNIVYEFVFTSNLKSMEKWKPVAKDMMRSLELQKK